MNRIIHGREVLLAYDISHICCDNSLPSQEDDIGNPCFREIHSDYHYAFLLFQLHWPLISVLACIEERIRTLIALWPESFVLTLTRFSALLNEIRKDIVNETSRSEWRREEIEVPYVCLFALTYCLYSIFLASSVAPVIPEPSFQYLYIAHCSQTTPANLVGPATITAVIQTLSGYLRFCV